MNARIRLKNVLENQEKARRLRDFNRQAGNSLLVSFSDDLSEIVLEGERIVIPEKSWLSGNVGVEGKLEENEIGYELSPQEKGKTVNLHLDAELVAELEQIKNHVRSKTQHEIVLELFKRGLSQYKEEQKG
ncbi:hypothetical protein BSNK01_25710 [Bacillaceae bacterium]